MSLIISLLVVIGLLAQQVTPATAAPDAYYLHDSNTGSSPAWYNTSWSYRKKLTVDAAQVPADQTDFPVLVSLATDSDLAAKAQNSPTAGYDILFTSSNGTSVLSHEIEKFDDTTGELVAWVEIGSLSSSADTEFYMYYGNPSALDQQDLSGTWSNGFEAVYHLHDDFTDSSGNHIAATNNGSADTTAGAAGDAQTFNGSSHYIDTNWTSNYASSANFTWTGWFKPNTVNGSDDILGIEDRGGSDNSEIRLAVRDDQAPSGEADSYDVWIRPDSGGSYSATVAITNPEDGNWHYAALQRDSLTGRLFYDGGQVDFGPVGSVALNFPVTLLIGAQWNTDGADQRNYFEGDLDEIRVINAVRTENWLTTEYNNISSPSTFYKPLGAEEQAPPSPSGKYINTTIGTGAATMTFDTGGQNAYWYTDVAYPTGTDDATIAAGNYTFNMYFSSLPAAWYDSNWADRKMLTIDSTQVDANLTNFPVLMSLTDTDLIGNVQADGGDILFTNTSGTKLDHEIEKITPGTGELVAWVELDSISSSVDTDFYMYFDNPGASNQWNIAGTWDSNYIGVWHLDESGSGAVGEFVDSTANNNDGTGGKGYSGYVPAQASAKIGDGQTFDGVNDFIDLAASGWYDANWPYRKRILIDGDQVSGSSTHSNFPVLISVTANTDNDLKHTGSGGHVGKTDGTDIFFTNDEGSKVDHEIESYDPATGELNIWVEVPELAVTNDTTLYMYYGYASATDQQNVSGTWDEGGAGNFAGVWHLPEDAAGTTATDLYEDSTVNANHGDDGIDATGKDGQIGLGQEFNDDYIAIPDPGGSWEFADGGLDAGTSDFTVSAWFYWDSTMTAVNPSIIYKGGGGAADTGYWFHYNQTNDRIDLRVADGTDRFTAASNPSLGITSNNWHHLTAVFDRETGLDTAYFYLNGSPAGSENSTLVADTTVSGTANVAFGSNVFIGNLDELRISSVARSADWIATEFANQDSPSTFHQFLSEETPSDVSLDLTGTALTLEAWVKYDAAAADNLGIMSKNGYSDGYRLVVDNPSHPISFDVTGEGSVGRVDTAGTISSDPDWHHIVGTWDGATMRVYIDGSVDANTDPRTGNVDRAGKEFWIGHGDHAIEKAWSFPWYGQMDEVRISDSARTVEWISTEYNNHENQGTGPGAFLKTLGSLESAPSVDIVVTVYHTKPDGSDPQEIVSSSTVTIDSNTANPYALTIGNDASGQTFTAADPRLLRLHVNVASVSGSGSFTLAYDSDADPSALDTPTVVVPDPTLVFVALAVFLPLLTYVMTERRRRRMAMRLATVAISLIAVIGMLAQDVAPAVAAPDVFYLHDNATPSSSITHVETQTSYDLPSVAGGTDQLYLIAVALYKESGSSATVSSISGTPLTWTMEKAQCSARIANPRVEIWQAFGSPGSFTATVNISGGAVRLSSAAISSYSGADPTTPTEGADGSNYDPANGCLGPYTSLDDTADASLSLTSSQNNSMLYVATQPRNRTITTPDPDYDQRAFISNSSGGDGANLYVHDRTLASAGTDSADHTISGLTDWNMAGLVINPASTLSPAGKYKNNDIGTGAATLAFDTGGQDAYWYTDISYPTGADDGSIAAGNYTLNMYFNALPSTPADWYNADWRYRKQITIDATEVIGASDHSSFPVLVDLNSDSDLAADAQADFDDVLFTSSNGLTKLSHEIEDFDETTGLLKAWVKVPTLSVSVDTILYMYYGNGTIGSQQNASGVWTDYEAVYHLHDDFLDSTGNGHTGTNSGSDDIAGRIADGQDFIGTDSSDHIDIGTFSAGTGQALTLQAWAIWDSWPTNDGRMLAKANGTAAGNHVFLLGEDEISAGNHGLRMRLKTGTDDAAGTTTLLSSATTIPLSQWVLLAGTYDGSDMRVIQDGIQVGITPKTGNMRVNAWDFWIGNHPGLPAGERWTDGILDEVRIAKITRSPNWLETEYNNQVAGSTFYKPLGSEETLPSVDITVSVHHASTDGSGATLITSASTTIDPNTANPLAFDLGSASAQTFTQADPRLIRTQIHVDTIYSSGSFTLAYDSAADPSNLDTPVLVVPDPTLIFGALALVIPVLTFALTKKRRRRMAARILSVVVAVIVALSMASRDVLVAVAAPDTFYLHDTAVGSGNWYDTDWGYRNKITIDPNPNGRILQTAAREIRPMGGTSSLRPPTARPSWIMRSRAMTKLMARWLPG
jgi:hypothetical protein